MALQSQFPFFGVLNAKNLYIYLILAPLLLPYFGNLLKYKIYMALWVLNLKDWKLIEAYGRQIE